jgi:undecaprenyl-diphosphatase
MSLIGLAVFAALAWCVHEKNALVRSDESAATYFDECKRANPTLTGLLEKATNFGSMETLIAVAILVSLAVFRARDLSLGVIWLVVLVGGDYLNKALKDAFQRPRPPSAHKVDWSFPSGHAMDSMIGYGMLIYLILVLVPRPGWRILPVVLLILLIGFTRVYLGAHYPSDVVGGFAAGAVWIGVWIMGIEGVRSAARKSSPSPH